MKHIKSTFVNNDGGSVLATTLYVVLLLSIIGMAAIQTSTVEVQISGNNRRIVEDFYFTEGAMITALERTDWWLNDGFLDSEATTAYWTKRIDFDQDDSEDALVEIRCVVKSDAAIASLSDAANTFPFDHHTAAPPVNSGFSARYFYTRKYAVTATGLRSGTRLQNGAWKVFNKY